MLISATLKYVPAQLIGQFAQLISVILWTHWLAPGELAIYTLVTVAQEMAYVACLGWFAVYALRYLPPPSDAAGRARYLGTENAVVLASVAAGMVAAVVVSFTLPPHARVATGTLAIGLFFVTRAINMHYAERARAQSAFVAYTLLQTVGPVGGLVIAWLALQRATTPDAWLLLFAYSAAQAIGSVLALPLMGMHWRVARPDGALLRAAIGFGLPLTGLGALSWAAENSIRYLVQWQSGATALGLMIVGWSLGRRCASVASMLVTTAAFPLAARLMNEGRRDEALVQLRINAALVFAVLAPVTAAVALLGPGLVALVVAPDYRQTSAELLALATLGGALRNLHLHVTDQLMVLDRRWRMAAEIDVVEIVLCGAATLAGLASHGLHGALAGQALGSLATLALSMHWADRHLGLQWPWLDTLRVLVATVGMAAALQWFDADASAGELIAGAALGAAVYGAAMALLYATPLRALVAARRR